ncbi:hypothetical protein ACGFYQ_34175 [Streptomyces sp. NPDC048258]|uniref:hypothetical protein n=1 Tax=Streptomyces sp. NPDC048258 TaxID=3365527 RepID=UPI00371CEAA3
MTRYGFAIKALPKGGKPFGDDEDDDEQLDETTEEADPTAPPASEASKDPSTDTFDTEPSPAEDPPADGAAPPTADEAAEVPAPPSDDARPWSGDMYDEGDETAPSAAFAAYMGSQGEEAWLDQAPDGTLTGWVRDSAGQVWRYSDADAWAIDVDDAQMTRAHSQAATDTNPTDDRGGQEPLFPPQ